MVDGTILTLLEEKWKHQIRRKYLIRFLLFTLYYCLFAGALLLRPERVYVSTSISQDGLVRFSKTILV